MKQYKFIYAIGIFALCAVGCSSQKSPSSKEISATEIYCTDVISVVSETYVLSEKDGKLRLKVKLKLEDCTDSEISTYPEVILKDEDGVEIISGWKQMALSSSEKSKFDSFVSSESGTVKEFVFTNEFGSQYFEDALTKTETFSIDKLRFEEAKDNDVEADSVFGEDFEKTLQQTKDIMEVAGDMMELNKSLFDAAKKLSK